MKKSPFILSIILLGSFSIATSAETQNSTLSQNTSKTFDYEGHAHQLIQRANTHMNQYYAKLRDIFHIAFKKYNSNPNATHSNTNEIHNSHRHFLNQLAYNLSVIPLASIKNDTLRRQVKILGKLQLNGLEHNDYEKAIHNLKDMLSQGTSPNVCHYRYPADVCKKIAYMPHIHEINSKTRILDELNYYWTNWREVIGPDARMKFVEFVGLMRKAAAYNGHVAPSKTWYLYYEEDNLFKELEGAMMDIMPLYQEMHAFMRNVLRKKYTEITIADDAPIPSNLMEQVLQHAWKAKSVFSPPFPERKLPDVKHKMEEDVFTAKKINEMAAEFFESMKLNTFSAHFWETYAKAMGDVDAGDDCKAIVYYFPPEVGLRYCPKVDFKKFLQMHGHLSEVQYDMYRSHLPVGLDREACPGFGSALGEASIVSAGSPRHLERMKLIDNYTLDTELTMNRLFRLGVHTLISIPMYLVNEKFIVDSIEGRIPLGELNCGYWKIMAQYAGLQAPTARTEDHFDPSFTFYKGLDPTKPNTVKLLSEILGYQIYRALCIATKQYVPGDHSRPLYNCDYYKQEKAGDLLKEVMKLGATKHWREAMQIITKEKKLSGKAIMEFYEPLHIWLMDQNRKNDVTVGWDESVTNCQAKT